MKMNKNGIDHDLLLIVENIINKDIDKILIRRLKHCNEVEIKVFLKDFRNPFSYLVTLSNKRYTDILSFSTDYQEKHLKKYLNENDDRYLIKEVWEMLENDDCIPFIGHLIDNQSDIWDKIQRV
jgi:hypothetical protein